MALSKSVRKKTPRYSSQSLIMALKDIREKKMSIREVCRNYGTPRATIQDRISGRTTDAVKSRGPYPLLSHEVEKHIVE